MNGTLLQKPSARRVIGMVVGIVIIGLGIALFKPVTSRQRFHQRSEYASGRALWHLAGSAEYCRQSPDVRH